MVYPLSPSGAQDPSADLSLAEPSCISSNIAYTRSSKAFSSARYPSNLAWVFSCSRRSHMLERSRIAMPMPRSNSTQPATFPRAHAAGRCIAVRRCDVLYDTYCSPNQKRRVCPKCAFGTAPWLQQNGGRQPPPARLLAFSQLEELDAVFDGPGRCLGRGT